MPSSPKTARCCSTSNTARYSVSGEGKCVLHIWSEERNIVRRVLDADIEADTLRLAGVALRAVAAQCAGNLRRSRLAHQGSRKRARGALSEAAGAGAAARVSRLQARPPEHQPRPGTFLQPGLHARPSCGSAVYFAVLGVNGDETQPSVDAALTFGILWMDHQRQQLAGRAQVEGLKLFLPPGRSEIVRQRAAHLTRSRPSGRSMNWMSAPRPSRPSISPTAATS